MAIESSLQQPPSLPFKAQISRRTFLFAALGTVSAVTLPSSIQNNRTVGLQDTPILPLKEQPQKLLQPETTQPETTKIDNLETFGHQQAFTQEALDQLVAQLNSHEAEMDPYTYYSTLFISETAYQQFPHDNVGETAQSFLSRHINELNRQLEEAQLPHLLQGTLQSRLQLRRLVVVKDNATIPNSGFVDYLGLNDSDGIYFVPSSVEEWADGQADGFYRPRDSRYYDDENMRDKGFLHEAGHSLLHLPDEYSLYYDTLSSSEAWWHFTSEPLGDLALGIPRVLQDYLGHPDRYGLMDRGHDRMSPMSAAQLFFREIRGNVHNREQNFHETNWAFPNEVPHETILDLGQDLSGATLQIYQAEGTYRQRRIKPQPVFNGEISSQGTANIGNPFRQSDLLPGNLIPAYNATLFLRLISGDRQVRFRWMDIRDFNLAYWLGYQGKATMKFTPFSPTSDPVTLDWTIQYFQTKSPTTRVRPLQNEMVSTL